MDIPAVVVPKNLQNEMDLGEEGGLVKTRCIVYIVRNRWTSFESQCQRLDSGEFKTTS